MAVPGAPTALVATPGDNQASIAFTPTAATPAVTSYQVRVGSGNYKTVTETGSPIVVKQLPNDVLSTIYIRAVNSDGNGASASVTVTPTDANLANNNGFTDATIYANRGGGVPQLDYNDPDD